MLKNATAAEDATQDTFLKAWSSINSFKGGVVRPWLLRIASNRCLDQLRSQSRRRVESLDDERDQGEPEWPAGADPGEDPEHFTIRVELSGHLEAALDRLSPDHRLDVLLSDVHGHTYEEIATITGLAIGTVKSRISRARSQLRSELQRDIRSRELLGRFGRFYDE